VILGDGPEREALLRAVREHGLQEVVEAPGFAEGERVEREMERALCMLLTSRREGYGMVVVEAAAQGTPSVVVAGEDNAATELISDGENGFIAASADPEAIAESIVRAQEAGDALRRDTLRWFAEHASELSLDASLQRILQIYAG
jgi:glycosyltransferase involved in cell wall biosynthesis